MDLPASVAALEEQLCGTGEIAPDPELFDGAAVFAAERERIFVQPWIALDHESRLAGDGSWFRADAAGRSLLATREPDGRLHALRNVCLHAGYPVCDAEEGPGNRLVCLYHGWEYTLDGRLVEPELSARIDPARLRLPSYPIAVRDGLIFVDLSGRGDMAQADADPIPAWLAGAAVTRRMRYNTTWNWKFALQFLKSSPQLFLDDAGAGESWRVFGPLSLMLVQARQAALVRVIPKFAGQTDIQLIEMTAGERPQSPVPSDGADRVADGLLRAGAEGPPAALDQHFFTWYWSLMSAS